jgi:hypothetical protein
MDDRSIQSINNCAVGSLRAQLKGSVGWWEILPNNRRAADRGYALQRMNENKAIK